MHEHGRIGPTDSCALTDAEQNAAKSLKVQDTVQTSTADGDSVELMLKKTENGKIGDTGKMRVQGFQIFITNFEHYRAIFLAQRVMLSTTIVRT